MKKNDLFSEFQKQLNELSVDSATYKVALSGGLDSVVLLHLFSRLENSSVIAHHIHHGLSINADKWACFCERFSTGLNIKCLVTKVILDKQSRTSLEALAREKRYLSLKEGLTENSYLVTAHHQDDQLETVLLALKRGAGLTGLQGIVALQQLQTGHLIRPLLNFSREQLELYAQFYKLNWIEDESNRDEQFDRNFIRHSITPLLKERWPSITKTVARSASHCQNQQSLIDEITDADFQHCLLTAQVLKIDLLKQLTGTRRKNVLRCWFKKAGLNYPSTKQLLAIWENIGLAQLDAEPRLLLQGKMICRYRGGLYIVDKEAVVSEPYNIIWQGQSIVELSAGKIRLKINVIDEKVKTQHYVEICSRGQLEDNLKCQPIDRDKSRSIKKLLHEYHVPPWLRDNVPFIIIDGVLVEAVGLFRCQTTLPQLLELSII
ncbi:MAG: tRNA lysidine(34) synthetase TilS [Psychromonas sp.]|nr:tRNA lysidine(34) synthetase TilS [Psychromonas sp.]